MCTPLGRRGYILRRAKQAGSSPKDTTFIGELSHLFVLCFWSYFCFTLKELVFTIESRGNSFLFICVFVYSSVFQRIFSKSVHPIVTWWGLVPGQVCGSALSRLVACEFFRQKRFHNRSPGDFESTLIKTGDSEKKGRVKGRRSNRREIRQSGFGSLRNRSPSKRSEPGRGCC